MSGPCQGGLCCITNIVIGLALSILHNYCASAQSSTAIKSTWDFRTATSKANVLAQISSSPYASLFNANAKQPPPVVNGSTSSANVSKLARASQLVSS